MEKDKAVSDSGPLIHLAEIQALEALEIFAEVLVPQEVFEEVGSFNLPESRELHSSRKITPQPLCASAKDYTKYLLEKFDLDLGESAALSLCKQEALTLFLTDDLAARVVAKELGLKPHGTIGVILRAYHDKIILKKTAVEWIQRLRQESSLFITTDLVNFVLREFEKTPLAD